MKRYWLGTLCAAMHIITGGNTQSGTPDATVVAAFLAQQQAEKDALKAKITELETAITLLTAQKKESYPAAQKNEDSLAARRTPSVIYYRRRGSNDDWKPVSHAYPLDYDPDNDYAHIMGASPNTMGASPNTRRSLLTTPSDLHAHIATLQVRLFELKKRLILMEIFLYKEFPDTFTRISS